MEEKDKEAPIATGAIIGGVVADETALRTEAFNVECDNFRSTLHAEVVSNRDQLMEKLKLNSDYIGDRSKAISTAYSYEVADIKMGGNGSANFDMTEKAELLSCGKLRGMEGHHINSVAEHPEMQTDPDNIVFYRGRKEHLQEGHNGDFRNPSSGPLIDRDVMLQQTNRERVMGNEIIGAGAAVIGGAANGVASSVITTCKMEGFSFKSVKKGLKNSGKSVFISSATSFVTYGITRGIHYLFTKI